MAARLLDLSGRILPMDRHPGYILCPSSTFSPASLWHLGRWVVIITQIMEKPRKSGRHTYGKIKGNMMVEKRIKRGKEDSLKRRDCRWRLALRIICDPVICVTEFDGLGMEFWWLLWLDSPGRQYCLRQHLEVHLFLSIYETLATTNGMPT